MKRLDLEGKSEMVKNGRGRWVGLLLDVTFFHKNEWRKNLAEDKAIHYVFV